MARILIFFAMFLAFACAKSDDIQETQTIAERPSRVTYCGTFVREIGYCNDAPSNCICDVVISPNQWTAARVAFNDSVKAGLLATSNYFRSAQALDLFPNFANPAESEELRAFLASGSVFAKEFIRYDITPAGDTTGVHPYYLFAEKMEFLESDPDVVIPLAFSN